MSMVRHDRQSLLTVHYFQIQKSDSAPDFLRVKNPTIRDSPVRHHNNKPCSRNVSSAMRIHRPPPPIPLISKPTTAATTTAATTTTTTTTTAAATTTAATIILATATTTACLLAYRVVAYVVCNDAIYCQ
jgi:hypothetical protein